MRVAVMRNKHGFPPLETRHSERGQPHIESAMETLIIASIVAGAALHGLCDWRLVPLLLLAHYGVRRLCNYIGAKGSF